MLIKCKTVDKEYFHRNHVLKKHIYLLEKVKDTFNPEDDIFFIKAPGRVNLIGEQDAMLQLIQFSVNGAGRCSD